MSKRLYGKRSKTKNMHNLIHLADDVRNMECNLSYLTWFPFENMLGRLKKQMRSGTHVLAQAARHLFEKHFLDTKKPGIPKIIEIVKEKIQPNQSIIQEMRLKTITLKPSYLDNTALLYNGTCISITKITRSLKSLKIFLHAKKLEKEEPMFLYPFNSSRLNMWKIKNEPIAYEIVLFLEHVKQNMVTLYTQDDENEPL